MAHSHPDRAAYIIEKEQLITFLRKPSCARTFPYALRLSTIHSENIATLKELILAINATPRFISDIFVVYPDGYEINSEVAEQEELLGQAISNRTTLQKTVTASMLSRPEVRFGPFADVFRTPDTPYGDLNAPAPEDEREGLTLATLPVITVSFSSVTNTWTFFRNGNRPSDQPVSSTP